MHYYSIVYMCKIVKKKMALEPDHFILYTIFYYIDLPQCISLFYPICN